MHHNYEARHCYIKFDTNFDPNDVIYHEKRHTIKNEEIRVHRTYGIAEGEQTDKRLFLKIEPKVDKGEEMEKALHVPHSSKVEFVQEIWGAQGKNQNRRHKC